MVSKETTINVGDYTYQTSDLIGHGAFAVVYKGRHKTKDYPVAIKTIAKKNLQKSQSLLGKEIKILEELTELHHENVVALLNYKETTEHVYLVMEYCNRSDLADYLHQKGTLSEDTIKFFLKQIAEAMKALYVKGIVHRDLKPQNILLCSRRPNPSPNEITLKIADFGFARFLGEGNMAATLCGSPMYMAPEVIMSLQYDAKADLWSIGTIVFQCLTGKAPFNAQSPPALKHFYEKNVNLAPKIPSGTSKDLTHLLTNLLKRNAKDRMDFDEFFNHPFIRVAQSRPVPVQRNDLSHTEYSFSSSSPLQSPVSYGSPMGLVSNSGSPERNESVSQPSSSESEEQIEDFVLVPPISNKPRGKNTDATGRQGYNPGCTDKSSNNSGLLVTLTDITNFNQPKPVPVPTQKEAYEKIRKSCQSIGKSSSATSDGGDVNWTSATTNKHEDTSVGGENKARSPSSETPGDHLRESRSSSTGSEGSNTSNRFMADISQLSPPTVQFVIGTPPGMNTTGSNLLASNRRCSAPILSATNCLTSPLMRQLTPPILQGLGTTTTTSELPYLPAICSPEHHHHHHHPHHPYAHPSSQHSHHHPRHHGDQATLGSRCNSSPMKFTFHETALNDKSSRSNQFTFGSSTTSGKAFLYNDYRCDKMLMNASSTIHHHHHATPTTGGHHCCCPTTTTTTTTTHISNRGSYDSLFIEGPMRFVAPELPEETLLDREHNETLARLNFVLTLVECIMKLAEHRGNALNLLVESAEKEISSPSQRQAEKLVLYVRALQLVSSALQLSQQEVTSGRLKTSASVRQVLRSMKNIFHECLEKCKSLTNDPLIANLSRRELEIISADKLIYSYAIEMCQSAALEELFGDLEVCFRKYQTAQILLHSLSQQVVNGEDKVLLSRYKDAVEKRLFFLHREGVVISMDNASSP